MTLFIDNFTVTGNADELVEFLRKYNTKTTVAGNIGDLCIHSSSCDISPEALNDVISFYQGRPINEMSNEELKEAIRMLVLKVDETHDLDDLSHDELVSLLLTYAPKSFGHL